MSQQSAFFLCERCQRVVEVRLQGPHSPSFASDEDCCDCPEITERRTKGGELLFSLVMCNALKRSAEHQVKQLAARTKG
jgi:hypothetical protein